MTDFFQAFKKDMLAFTSSSIPKDFPEPATPVQIEYDWTGIMGYTKSGCSIVGRISLERPSEFLCVGHQAEGMCRCFALSTTVTQALLPELNGQEYKKPEWFPSVYSRNC